MISKRNIICFASGWDYHPTSKHHIMRRLSEHNNVIWVNWHASRRPRLGFADACAIVSKLRQIQHGPKEVCGAITTLTPLQLPMPSSALARRMNAVFAKRSIARVLARFPDWPVQIWSFAPDVGEVVTQFDPELVLYYCVDAFGEFPGYDAALIDRLERQLMSVSDIVVTTSPPLYDAKRQLHPNVHAIQHGVDHAHLSRAVHHEFPMPEELKRLKKPIFGFVGVIGDWVDLDIIAGLAKARPDVSIAMIGPELRSRGACGGLKNVYWLGGKDHTMLPAYLQHFDVGLIPFKHQALTYNANPIKLYEYLAAGVPTVSTSLPAVEAMAGHVWVADDPVNMATACDEALRCNDAEARAARSELMTAESWSARLEQLSELISTTCGPRATRTSTVQHSQSLTPAVQAG